MQIDLSQTQRMIEWFKDKLYLNAISSNASRRAVRRGQVYRCNFGCGVGSEIQKDRPAVIVQNDIANGHSGNTIVIPITHNTSTLPCIVNFTPQISSDGKVILDGQANASNMLCVSKARLGDFVTTLPAADMMKIDEAIAKSVDLMRYYADIEKQLKDKLEYIEKIKEQRNKAQDELKNIYQLLGVSESTAAIEEIKKLQKKIDR
jgi:mRNA interferase MazF